MVQIEDALVAAVREVAELGGRTALEYFRSELKVDDKAGPGAYDPVTEGDRAAERAMRGLIEARFPEHGVLGEEYGETRPGSEWRWVLDPIDGTRGFVSGTPAWTTLVGLEREGSPVVGAIVQPFTKEVWHGFPGGAEYHGPAGRRVCCASRRVRLEEARIATTDPRPTPKGALAPDEAEAFARVAERCPVARFGLDAYGYGLLALGQIDLVIEAGLQRYDVSALIPVLRGAGARATAWDGGDPSGGGRMVAAATAELANAARELLRAG